MATRWSRGRRARESIESGRDWLERCGQAWRGTVSRRGAEAQGRRVVAAVAGIVVDQSRCPSWLRGLARRSEGRGSGKGEEWLVADEMAVVPEG